MFNKQVAQFLNFESGERLTLSMLMIQGRTSTAAENMSVTTFKVSAGWLT